MAKKKKKLNKKQREKRVTERFHAAKEVGAIKERKLRDELGEHASDAESHLVSIRSTWDEKEALLICKLKDEISTEGSVHSQVFDPRLSTVVFERAARVMARNPKGKVFAVSKNDMGKSKLMNLLISYYQKNANYWHPMLVKCRMMDLYSLVYGTMFALVPWVVDPRKDYIGPEMIPLPIRSCFPQPSATSVGDSDWFQVSSMKSVKWLEQQAKMSKKWKDIDKLKTLSLGNSGDGSGDTKPSEQITYVESEWYGGEPPTDSAFPRVELRTEYRRDRWVTFAPAYDNLVVRDIKNPYDNGELPIVAKYAWPLMDSIIGLGEFERGKTLQYAVNSLINLYMDTVKYSIFPPLHINAKDVVDTTIKWEPGAKWLMKRPGEDVRQMRLSPQGLNTFQSTYSFLISALMNQAGTTEISSPGATETTLGRTPQAIKMIAGRESARDEWDRTMMEQTLTQVYSKWTTMIVKKMERGVVTRVFGQEAKEIQKDYPDLMEFFDKKQKYGSLKITKKAIDAKYDFEIETGSIMRPDLDAEQQNVGAILGLVLKNPAILEAVREKGKDIDIGELFKRWMIAGGVKDWDRVIVEKTPEEIKKEDEAKRKAMAAAAPPIMPPGMPLQGGQMMAPMMPPGGPMMAPGAPPMMPPGGPMMVPPGGPPPIMTPPPTMMTPQGGPPMMPQAPQVAPQGGPMMAPGGQSQIADAQIAEVFAAIQAAQREVGSVPVAIGR